uniref:Predicted protein n=1 Tax=Hordeum vulgare subsp. vulgare TaxID=112509 RepID=F2E8C7_HORVV|nr:predicted protein [Hordeum vulgare subsp. vulgare]
MRNGAAFWNQHDTDVFCEICKEEIDAGNTTVDGCLNAQGYSNLQLKFNDITQRGYVKEHFKYRWNSLKYQYTRFTNPPDNLSVLEELFGKAHVGKLLDIPLVEDLGEDEQETARVGIGSSDEDAELTLSGMRKPSLAKCKVSSPVVHVLTMKEGEDPLLLEYKKENFGEDKQEAARINIGRSDEDAELTLSAMKKTNLGKRKVSSPMGDMLTKEDNKPLLLVYKKKDLGEDKDEATQVSVDGSDEDAELPTSAMRKLKLVKREDSSPTVAAASMTEDKHLLPGNYKKARNDDHTATADAFSCDSGTVPTMREAVRLIRECGVSEATDLFYTATRTVVMNPEYRELFALIRTREGRLDWLQRAHDEYAMRVHLSASK